jgi:hypothetical protein
MAGATDYRPDRAESEIEMTDELNTGETPAENGDKPAETPAAEATPKEGAEEKTAEQLEAEKKAADEAKQKEADEAEEQAVKKKPWFQKRIDEITRQRHEEKARADRLEQMLQRVIDQAQLSNRTVQPGQQQQPPQQQSPPEFVPTRPPPTREQFEFDEEKYIQATVDYRLEQREAKQAQERQAAEQRTSQEGFYKYYEDNRVKTLETGKTKYPDYEDVVFALPANVMTPELALAIFETGTPADIAYHLGKNPAEAERISKLPPLRKAVELGKLETKIQAAASVTTKAPPPPTPIGGREPATKTESQMSMDEWLKARKAGKVTGKT